jgi:hypothetical protein
MSSSKKNPDAVRMGGPGSSQQNRQEPDKGEPKQPHPHQGGATGPKAKVSGGGGEADIHHDRNTRGKAGRT